VQPTQVSASTLSIQHILACLARLELAVRREVVRFRLAVGPRADDDLRGLYISDEEVDGLLSGEIRASQLLDAPRVGGDILQEFSRGEQGILDQIASLEKQAAAQGIEVRLSRLAELFRLSPLEREVVVICLAPEIDLKYERLYAYLQDDVTKKRPTVDLVMRLLSETMDQRVALRQIFQPGSALLEWDLVSLNDDPGARKPVLPARYLKLDERISGFLLGSDQMDGRLLALAEEPAAGSGQMPQVVRERLEEWAVAWARTWKERAPVVMLHGRYGSGRRAAANALAEHLGMPCLAYNAAWLGEGVLRAEQAVRLAEREALLRGGVICWSQVDGLLHADGSGEVYRERDGFIRALAAGWAPVILLGGKAWEPGPRLGGRPYLRLAFPENTYTERKVAWTERLNGSARLSESEIDALAGRFRLTPGQIHDAVGRAWTLMWSRDPREELLVGADLDAASRDQAQNRLGSLARKLTPRYRWEDIVLPRPQLATLQVICATIRQRPRVYGDWGFDRKLSLGKGVIALFSGPSGTGKTMSAEIIANELGLDLFKINLSAVVSKYIGETEKNLEQIFSEAQDSDAILFFDEADALFGKRSEVKDAHDRYANIETAYLLQRTEEYNGLVILASNIKKNMDEAFIRRIHFMVDFPFPEEPERMEIWRRTFPPEAPKADDIDLAFLARKLKIAGGNIRNIILTAAFLAAEERRPIGMPHLVRGASLEYQKMGKMIVEGDFEKYFEHARG
jgi:SpoVK/Ycf46/Vps4 family AAA+-type ATPase